MERTSLFSDSVTAPGQFPLSLGCAQLGNLHRPLSNEDAVSIVESAWEHGLRYFDTAPHYGLGLSERRLGQALRGRPRDTFIVSTKVGRLLESRSVDGTPNRDRLHHVPATHERVWDFSRDGVRRSLEESLERLGTDRVDVVYLHDPDDHAAEALDDAYPALEELRAQGVVRAIGAGMNQSALLTRFVRETDVDVVMIAGRLTLLDSSAADDLVPACSERGVGVAAAGVFNSGVLATLGSGEPVTYDYAPAPDAVLHRARRIQHLCHSYGTDLATVALQFPLRFGPVETITVGCDSAEQVARNVTAAQAPIPEGLWEAINQLIDCQLYTR
ncbi:aldo/keto reductase [Ruania alkalisoli]|uniref:aldo/keto reductase n=1 Tax=Ruania alkalisoli TaxID=2779775 RepID=UPI001FE440ED|nr:aldo/keto reductase [Ruania alkalisoli]